MHFLYSFSPKSTRSLRSILVSTALLFQVCNALASEVAFAGFAYAGDLQTSAKRFPYSKLLEGRLTGDLNSELQKSVVNAKPENFALVPRIDDLKGRDQAVAVAMVMTNETVSTERFGAAYKVLVQLRAQAMFFDFKSKTVLRAYPISFTYIDVLAAPPTPEQITERIGAVYRGTAGKAGLIQRFVDTLQRATIPSNVPRFVQVTNVSVSDEAREQFPEHLRGSAGDTWIADALGEAISSKLGIPILPYAKGYAIGNVMSMTIGDSTVFNLTLPKPDYEFSAEIVKLKKVLYSDQPAGKSFIYGTLAKIELVEPLSETAYLRSGFKNGEVKVVPATQLTTDDFPAFEDSMRGLFAKLSRSVAGEEPTWLKSAADSKDIDQQIIKTRELLKLCK
jgi:hypothetical protein